jgi:hypothetical protein
LFKSRVVAGEREHAPAFAPRSPVARDWPDSSSLDARLHLLLPRLETYSTSDGRLTPTVRFGPSHLPVLDNHESLEPREDACTAVS